MSLRTPRGNITEPLRKQITAPSLESAIGNKIMMSSMTFGTPDVIKMTNRTSDLIEESLIEDKSVNLNLKESKLII